MASALNSMSSFDIWRILMFEIAWNCCVAVLLLIGSPNHAERKTPAVQKTGTGRPRGRPKKIIVDQTKQANVSQKERHAAGSMLLY